jgi:hypothetical protein
MPEYETFWTALPTGCADALCGVLQYLDFKTCGICGLISKRILDDECCAVRITLVGINKTFWTSVIFPEIKRMLAADNGVAEYAEGTLTIKFMTEPVESLGGPGTSRE